MSPVTGDAGVLLQPCQSEIGDPQITMHIEQKIAGLNVAVQDALLVGIGQGLGRLDPEPSDVFQIHRTVELGIGRDEGLHFRARVRHR